MVSKLSLICLRSICDGVETGQIRGPQLGAYIPPNSTRLSPINLRQRLLDLALIRGSMDNPNCIAAFSSTEFLDGMTSLNTTTINIDKNEYRLSQYVLKLAVSLGAISRINADVTIGSRFNQLQLWADESDLDPIGHIVFNCPNIRALKLSIVQYGTNENADHSVRLFAQNPVFSYLEELSIDYYRSRKPQSIAQSIIGIFLADVQLSSLRTFCIRAKTYSVNIDIEDWTRFLQGVRSTLTSMEVDGIRFSIFEVLGQLIPFPMDHLQRLRLGSDYLQFLWSPDILAQCMELAYLDVPLHGSIGIEEARVIQQLDVNLAVNLRLRCSDANSIVQNQSRFRLVDMFGENVTSFGYSASETWNEQYITALADVFASCPNMTNFQFVATAYAPRGLIDLSPLFDNANHRYLKGICFMGNVNVGKLFEKYVDLESLVLAETHPIRDQDLIGWTRLGGGRRLSRVVIFGCANLTYNGIVALLIAAGSTLEEFQFYCGRDGEKERLQEALIKYCPFAIFDD